MVDYFAVFEQAEMGHEARQRELNKNQDDDCRSQHRHRRGGRQTRA